MSNPKSGRLDRISSLAAFTLLEMLAVVAIMVLVAAFMIPSLGTIVRGRGVARAASDISELLETARATAMSKNTYVWVGFRNNVTVTSSGTTFQLKAVAVRSIDGSPNLSALDPTSGQPAPNYQPFTSVLNFENVRMDTLGNLSPSTTGSNSLKSAMIIQSGTKATIFDCELASIAPTDPPLNNTGGIRGFVIPPMTPITGTNAMQFLNNLVFTPQGESVAYTGTNQNIYILTGTTSPIPVIQFPFYSSQIFLGLGPTVNGKLLASGTNNPDAAGILIYGGIGKNRIYRAQAK